MFTPIQFLPQQSLAPTITGFAPSSGAIGDTLRVYGTSLTGATSATVNGIALTGVTVLPGGAELQGVIAAGTTTGRVVVVTPAGSATSPTDFVITVPNTGGTSYTDEQAQDAAGSLLATGQHSGIVATYGPTQDGANRLDLSVQLPTAGLFYWSGTALQPVTIGSGLTLTGGVLSTTSGGGGTLTFSSFGDTNGLFYYLGTNGLTASWVNPIPGVVAGVMSSNIVDSFPSLMGYTVERLSNRANADLPALTDNLANSWVGFRLTGRTIAVTDYTIRTRSDSNSNHPTGWILEGSNNVTTATPAGFNAATWTQIDIQSGITLGVDSWARYTTTGAVGYSAIRLRQTATNSSGHNYLILGEIELYGQLVEL